MRCLSWDSNGFHWMLDLLELLIRPHPECCTVQILAIVFALYWNDLPSPFTGEYIVWEFETEVLPCYFYRETLDLVANPPVGKPLTSSKRRHPVDLSLADRGTFECRNLGTLSSCLHRSGYRDLEEFSDEGQEVATLSPLIMEVEDYPPWN